MVVVAAATLAVIPGAATVVQSLSGSSVATSSSDTQPTWNSGNLCTPTAGPSAGDWNCVSIISKAPYPLWYNFSAGEIQGGVVNIWIYGSNDCIYLNFHSFDTKINIYLYGSEYSCPSSATSSTNSLFGPIIGDWSKTGCSSSVTIYSYLVPFDGNGPSEKSCKTGVNIVVNAEYDTLNLVQCGSSYATNVTVYGTTTVVNSVQGGCHKKCSFFSSQSDHLTTTIIYIGTTAGFSTCPSGITDGRVTWSEKAYGSHDTFNTIFIDGTNVVHAPANYAYSTEPLLPPDGHSYGYENLYGNETTQIAPTGSCSYILE